MLATVTTHAQVSSSPSASYFFPFMTIFAFSHVDARSGLPIFSYVDEVAPAPPAAALALSSSFIRCASRISSSSVFLLPDEMRRLRKEPGRPCGRPSDSAFSISL